MGATESVKTRPRSPFLVFTFVWGLPHRESFKLSLRKVSQVSLQLTAASGSTDYQFWGWCPLNWKEPLQCGRPVGESFVDIRPSIYHDLEHPPMLGSERVGRVPPQPCLKLRSDREPGTRARVSLHSMMYFIELMGKTVWNATCMTNARNWIFNQCRLDTNRRSESLFTRIHHYARCLSRRKTSRRQVGSLRALWARWTSRTSPPTRSMLKPTVAS